MNVAISLENLSLGYEGENVLENLNLQIPTGTLTGILGQNGAGKTTLLQGILGFLKPRTGSVSFPSLSMEKGRGKSQLAYVPQTESVDWDFPTTVLDVVLMGRYGKCGLFRPVGKKDKIIARDALEKVGLSHLANRPLSKLSGGQRQRVFLARAIAQEGEIYFLDEPFQGVDKPSEAVIFALLQDLQQEGKTLLLVHHDHATVSQYFDHVILVQGKNAQFGKTQDLWGNPVPYPPFPPHFQEKQQEVSP